MRRHAHKEVRHIVLGLAQSPGSARREERSNIGKVRCSRLRTRILAALTASTLTSTCLQNSSPRRALPYQQLSPQNFTCRYTHVVVTRCKNNRICREIRTVR
jgi:hypothetical protein